MPFSHGLILHVWHLHFNYDLIAQVEIDIDSLLKLATKDTLCSQCYLMKSELFRVETSKTDWYGNITFDALELRAPDSE